MRANRDWPLRICAFFGFRRKSALTFLFTGIVSWGLTRLRMRCKYLDFCLKKYFPRSKNIFGQETSDLRYKEKCYKGDIIFLVDFLFLEILKFLISPFKGLLTFPYNADR